MDTASRMQVKEVFTLSDGKSIFLGLLTGIPSLVRPGRWKLLIDKAEHSVIDITGEQIMTRRAVASEYRALSTYTLIKKEELDTAQHLIELVLTT